jgi:hypothetical protein
MGWDRKTNQKHTHLGGPEACGGRPRIGVAKCLVCATGRSHRVSPPQDTFVGNFKACLLLASQGRKAHYVPKPTTPFRYGQFLWSILLSLLSAANWKMGWCKLLYDMVCFNVGPDYWGYERLHFAGELLQWLFIER